MPYSNTQELKADVLFRAGEGTTSSDWSLKVVDYLNRVYRTLCSGASEFLPEYVDDWWWLRDTNVLTILPSLSGSVEVTEGSTSITFGTTLPDSVVGYRLRIHGHSDVFEIASHTAGFATAELDSPYTGESNISATYKLMKVHYTLQSDVAAIMAPMISFSDRIPVAGLSPERMDELFPLMDLSPGIPKAFALENPQTVRFSHGGRDDGRAMRMEYRYRPTVVDLTDDELSIPLVPLEWRHLLSDMALTYVLLDKNDDRSNAIALSARTGLAGMLKENRRRLSKMGRVVGRIFPRAGGLGSPQGPLRTESGLIIGY